MEIDRLSSLPNSIIYHILSVMDTKYAVQTCVLAKKWRYHWTNIHSLDFDYEQFHNWSDFKKFVLNVLNKRKPLSLRSIKYFGLQNMNLMRKILRYAKSHNIEELDLEIVSVPPCLLDILFPGLFECKTLRALRLCPFIIEKIPKLGFAPLTSLTTLKLVNISSVTDGSLELFSSCLNLRHLHMHDCSFENSRIINVTSPHLISLDISSGSYYGFKRIKKIVICAPRLKFFKCYGKYPLVLTTDKIPDLDEVDIQMFRHKVMKDSEDSKEEYIRALMSMAEAVSHANSLTITLELSEGRKLVLRRDTPTAGVEVVERNYKS